MNFRAYRFALLAALTGALFAFVAPIAGLAADNYSPDAKMLLPNSSAPPGSAGTVPPPASLSELTRIPVSGPVIALRKKLHSSTPWKQPG